MLTMIPRKCCYCKETFGWKEGEAGQTTHGICDNCVLEPYKRATLEHVVSCHACEVREFTLEGITPRCIDGVALHEHWEKKAREKGMI